MKPPAAISAAKSPDIAPWPGWNGFIIEPKFARSPQAWLAAMPSAVAVVASFSPFNLDAAATAPKALMIAVG